MKHQQQVKGEEAGCVRGWDAWADSSEVSQACTEGKGRANKEMKGKGNRTKVLHWAGPLDTLSAGCL